MNTYIIDWRLPEIMRSIDKDIIDDKAVKHFNVNPLNICTKDGICLEVDARMIIQLDDASFIIARFGSIPDLVKERVDPLINNFLSNKERITNLNREKLGEELIDVLQTELVKYHVKVQYFTIVYFADVQG